MNEVKYSKYQVFLPKNRGPFYSAQVVNENGEPTSREECIELLRALQERYGHYLLKKERKSHIYLMYGYVRKYKRKLYKIGFADDPYRRSLQLKLNVIHSIECPYNKRTDYEIILQGHFIEMSKWVGGEYFDLDDNDVNFIKKLSWAGIHALPSALFWFDANDRPSKRDIPRLYHEMRDAGFEILREYIYHKRGNPERYEWFNNYMAMNYPQTSDGQNSSELQKTG